MTLRGTIKKKGGVVIRNKILRSVSAASAVALAFSISCVNTSAHQITCDHPGCQFDAFKSNLEHTYQYSVYASNEYDIDEYVLFAIMYRESRFMLTAKNYNTNGSIDSGICQINSINRDWLYAEGIDIYTGTGNIEAAAKILSMYIHEYGCTEREAIAAYGAGYSGMLKGRGFSQSDKLYETIEKIKAGPVCGPHFFICLDLLFWLIDRIPYLSP